MKKLIMIAALFITLLIPVISFAGPDSETELIHEIKSWRLFQLTNVFTDNISYILKTKTIEYGDVPEIFISNEVNRKIISFKSNIKDHKSGIIYRVDNKKAVTFRYRHFAAKDKSYLLLGNDYNKVINDFRNGKTLKYKIYSFNESVNINAYTISLEGFTELYDMMIKMREELKRIK